jgi:hypothetical protein
MCSQRRRATVVPQTNPGPGQESQWSGVHFLAVSSFVVLIILLRLNLRYLAWGGDAAVGAEQARHVVTYRPTVVT